MLHAIFRHVNRCAPIQPYIQWAEFIVRVKNDAGAVSGSSGSLFRDRAPHHGRGNLVRDMDVQHHGAPAGLELA